MRTAEEKTCDCGACRLRRINAELVAVLKAMVECHAGHEGLLSDAKDTLAKAEKG